MLYQLTRGSRLQSMDAWISSRLSKLQERDFQKFQEEIKRQSLFITGDDRASRKQSLIMAKVISYLKKSSLEVGHHPSRHGHESTWRDAFLFWNHFTVIIFEENYKKALNLWVLLKKNSQSSSGHMPLKENNQDGVLKSTCPRRKTVKMNDC